MLNLKYLFPFTIFLVLGSLGTQAIAGLSLQNGTQNILIKNVTDNDECLLGHWIHSYEEDKEKVTTYRKKGYSFPPSRGRVGIDFHKDGELTYFGISPVDGSKQQSGKWSMPNSTKVKIEINNARIKPFTLRIETCETTILKVQEVY